MSDALIVRRGGSGGLSPNKATIHVKAPAGSNISFSKGGIVAKSIPGNKGIVNAADTDLADYYYSISSGNYGEWTVTATREGKERSAIVTVESNEQYDVRLIYKHYFIENGLLVDETKVSNKTCYHDTPTFSYVVNGNGGKTYLYFIVDDLDKYSKIVFHVYAMGGFFSNGYPKIGASTGVPTSVTDNTTPSGNVGYLKMGDSSYSKWLDENTYQVSLSGQGTGTYYVYLWGANVSNTSGKPAWTSEVGTPYFYILDWYLE